MIIDSAKLNGPCSCGRSHEMITKEAIIEPGCLKKLDLYTDKYGLTGKRAVIYDENTYHAKTSSIRPLIRKSFSIRPISMPTKSQWER